MELPEILNRIYPLPETSMSKILTLAEEITVNKNVGIISPHTPSPYVYFVKTGIVRAYIIADGREITFWIGEEGTVALSLQSYINSTKGYEYIAAVESSALYRVPSEGLHKLYDHDIHLANWGRRFAELEILRAEKCLIPQLFTTGRERYESLLETSPGLLQRVPLEHLATYLGLTPVSLSRIRASIDR